MFEVGGNKTKQRLRAHRCILWAVWLTASFGRTLGLSSSDSTEKILLISFLEDQVLAARSRGETLTFSRSYS